ncbi:MAG: HD domain-containing protein [Patescibacteria group bacterium]|nr:HD domain-containing protein [Patescibacteria group bacterium]
MNIEFPQLPAMYSSEDHIFMRRAFAFAKKAHEGQNRRSGQPYFIHPAEVAAHLISLRAKPEVVAAGFLHDVLEDTPVAFQEIGDQFGFEVAKIVNALTKSENYRFHGSMEERKRREEHHRFLDTIKDIRSAIVKLCDRHNNMRTIQFLSPERQEFNAAETIKLYVPLARQIGLYDMERELEQLSLSVLSKEMYEQSLKLSEKYEKEIEEKGYHQNKLHLCMIESI